jgi:hypothetical protein
MPRKNSGQGNWQGLEKLRTKITQDQNNSGPGKLRTRKLAGQVKTQDPEKLRKTRLKGIEEFSQTVR